MKNEKRSKQAERELVKFRKKIDAADKMLLKALAKRFRIIEKVARLKFKHGIPIVQKARMAEIMRLRRRQAKLLKIEAKMVSSVFALVHDSAVSVQKKIFKKARKAKK